MLVNNKCFCGSNEKFSNCCQLYIEQSSKQQAFPQTPEQLMRSRFSAYANGNSQYVYDTYSKSSQASQSINEINDWSKACVWIALQIHSKSKSDIAEDDCSEQFVEFSAIYITDNILCELRENSRFILEEAKIENNCKSENQPLQWRYIDGNIIEHTELSTLKRKELCPCNHYPTAWSMKKGKKYKQCCGSN
jgi:SEC-C motif-containing protein